MKWRLPRLRRFRWPSAATAIAVLALILSAVQFVFSVPLLTQFYIRSELVVVGPPRSKDKIPFAGYKVSNEGNVAATKIELGFMVEPSQRVAVMPAISTNIVEQDQGDIIKLVRVELDRLSPGEGFSVLIFPPKPSKQTEKADVPNLHPIKLRMWLPAFSFVRSAEGPGRYIPAEGEKGFWTGTKTP